MSRNFDTAAEFCEIAGTPDLLEYLQVSPDVDAAEAQAKLKKRRKYMQGMQSNPKYRKEALFLIKHFKALSDVLNDPAAYQVDALRRAESVHLPILEMTVKGVLAGGSLSDEQEKYLRRNAAELGVSDVTFDELLERLCREAGVSRPNATKPSEMKTATPATAPPIRQPGDDFYALLGVEPGAPLQRIRAAYEQKMAAARSRGKSPEVEALIVRLDLAWSVLSDPRARSTYQIAQTRTGPPARARDAQGPPRRPSSSADTLPSYSAPMGPGSRLEVLGEPVRYVSVGTGPTRTSVRIRNGGSDPMTGRISCDQPWVSVHPRQIDPSVPEQDIEVTFQGAGIPGNSASAVVNIITDRGERASITFQVSRSRTMLYAGLAGLLALLALAVGGWALTRSGPGDLTIHVDPWGHEVFFDEQLIGEGAVLRVQRVSRGDHTIEIRQPNFAALKRKISTEELEKGEIRVELQQTRRLNFDPGDDLRRSAIPQEEASRVFSQRSSAIDQCIRRVVKPDRVLTGAIRVHIDKDGLAAGLETQGKHTDEPEVERCLERQAAALMFSALENGDYATVRYEYTVTGSDGT